MCCCIGHNGGRVVPYHAVPVARRGPFGEELVLSGNVRKALENLGAYVGIDKVQQREKRPEGVPESGIRVEVAVVDFAVVRAVVDGLSIGADFIELPGEERTAIKAGVESAVLLLAASGHADAAKNLVPAGLGG